MIIEAFVVKVKEGREKQFEDAFRKMLEIYKDVSGLMGQMLLKRKNYRRTYLIVSRWRSLEELEKFKSYFPFEKYENIIAKSKDATIKQSRPRHYLIINETK